jgi:hypothetical protein
VWWYRGVEWLARRDLNSPLCGDIPRKSPFFIRCSIDNGIM